MALLEIMRPLGIPSVTLDGETVNIGKSADNDLVIETDPTLSRHHARVERVGAAWTIEDLNSKNGTLINGERIFGTCVLRHGDELQLGETQILFRDAKSVGDDTTKGKPPPPHLTVREKEVLRELCRPVLNGTAFTQPASRHEIAQALYVGDAAVQAHLGRLYDKFGIEDGQNRRTQLANAAIESGAVRRRDLDGDDDTG
jgi:DNA-binding CsgD family transcriptional regulator